jgi:hypothetical protein
VNAPSAVEVKGIDAWFQESLNRLARGTAVDLNPFLQELKHDEVLNGSRATVRAHFVARDGNGRLQTIGLTQFLAQQVIDYCIPRNRINEAHAHFEKTKSSDFFVKLNAEARALFTTLTKSGEGGELLIFVLLERLLGIPQILCKMNLKTSSQMHIHGVDGVHAHIIENGKLGLYWCESKLYASFSAAVAECMKSIAPFLNDLGDGASQRDLQLVRDYTTLGDPVVDDLIIRLITNDPSVPNLVEVRGASLIGFDLDDYPNLNDSGRQEDIMTLLRTWTQTVANRVTAEGLEAFHIDVFCVPVESVQNFRDALLRELSK